MNSIISTFHIDWKIIIAQAINFGIVFAILYFYALKPLSKLMAERSEKITKGVDDAKSNAELLNKTRAEYEEVLLKAKKEANLIFQESKKEAEAKKEQILEAAKIDMLNMVENGKKTLENEKIKMVEEAKKEIVSLTVKVTEKLLGSRVDASYEEKVIKELNNL